MAAIKVDVRVDVKAGDDSHCSTPEVSTGPSGTGEAPVGEPYPFSMVIISHDGDKYWKVDSDAFGQARALAEASAGERAKMEDLVRNQIQTTHVPNGRPTVTLLGTFFLNLSAFKTQK